MQKTKLDLWLRRATRCLSGESAHQVRREIEEHYESAFLAAVAAGATSQAASDAAILSLGSPRLANRQYRKVLLTSTEAAILRIARRESSAACERHWIVWLLRAATVVALAGAPVALLSGQGRVARSLFIVAIGTGVFTASSLFRIRTVKGGRIFRAVKWTAVLASTWILFGPDPFEWLSGIIVVFGSILWVEWTYYSIRKKLPVSDWPKALFY